MAQTEFKVDYLQFHHGDMRTITVRFNEGQYRNPEKAAKGYAAQINRGETGKPPLLFNKEAKVYKRYITDWEEHE